MEWQDFDDLVFGMQRVHLFQGSFDDWPSVPQNGRPWRLWTD